VRKDAGVATGALALLERKADPGFLFGGGVGGLRGLGLAVRKDASVATGALALLERKADASFLFGDGVGGLRGHGPTVLLAVPARGSSERAWV